MKNKFIGISLTKSAQKHIANIMNKNNAQQGIKIKIKKSGCAGFQYYFSIIKNKNNIKEEKYYIYHEKKIKIYIPIKYMQFFDGTIIKLIKNDEINYSLQFDNAKIKQFCGCGKSFSLSEEI